jgi:hypothetical protein
MDELVKPMNLEDTIITLLNQSLTSKSAKNHFKTQNQLGTLFLP